MIYKLLDCADNTTLNIKMFGCGYFIIESDKLPYNLIPYLLREYDMTYDEYKKESLKNDNNVYNLMGTVKTTWCQNSVLERV